VTDTNARGEIKRRWQPWKTWLYQRCIARLCLQNTPKYRDTSTPVEYVDHGRLR